MGSQTQEAGLPLLHDIEGSAGVATCTSVGITNDNESLSVDEILKQWAGELGWGQLIQSALVSLAWLPMAMQSLVTIFAEKPPAWRCRRSPFVFPSVFDRQENGFHSWKNASDTSFLLGLQETACTPNLSICSMNQNLWEWIGGNSQSTVSEYMLICGDDYKIGLVQSAFFTGCLIAAGLFGNLSDSFLGRKGALVVASTLASVSNLFTAISPNYWVYLFLRLVTGMSNTGLTTCSFVLATEPVGPTKRALVGMATFYYFSAGSMILSGLAYLSHSWRVLYFINFCITLLYGLIVFFFVSESPRWFVARGRKDEALIVLRSIAKRNGRTIPTGVIALTDHEYSEENTCNDQQASLQRLSETETNGDPSPYKKASATLLDVFRAPATRTRMIIMIFVWLACAMVYYGVNLNVVNLGTNVYVGFLLNAVAEVPANAITTLLLGRFGRRNMFICLTLLSAVCSLVGAYVCSGQGLRQDRKEGIILGSRLKLACGVLLAFCITAAFNVLYVYTAELFPTVVRNTAVGVASQAAQVGTVTAPMVVSLGHGGSSVIPFATFSVACVIAMVLAFQLVETGNMQLFDTIEGMNVHNEKHGQHIVSENAAFLDVP